MSTCARVAVFWGIPLPQMLSDLIVPALAGVRIADQMSRWRAFVFHTPANFFFKNFKV
jgi:hypothetical protein